MHPKDLTGGPNYDIDADLNICITAGIAYQPKLAPFDYGQSYHDHYTELRGTKTSAILNRIRLDTVTKAINIDEGNNTDYAIIDVGIGSGDFIDHIHSRRLSLLLGFGSNIASVHGHDINPVAIDWLDQRQLNYDLYGQGAQSHHILTLWDTIEHLPDPDQLFDVIQPGSLLCTSLPIFPSLERKLLMASKHYKPDEHLYYFTNGGFIAWMERSHFQFLAYHNRETTEAGRESIGTFTFRKR